MASINYDINVNASQAQQNLAKLQSQIQKTSDVFGGLKTAIASLALGAAIKNAINYADAIKDISDATGVGVANVIGFGKAVQANGGDAEKANQALVKLTLSIGDAASGSLQAQDAFAQVGITLNDLRTLSEQDIFGKTLEGLSKIDDLSKRAKLANELLGKAIKGVNIGKVSEDYNKAVISAQKYAKSVETAAAVQDKLDAAVSTFKLSILKAIEPIANFVANLDSDKIDRFINAVVQIGLAAGSIIGLTKAFQALTAVLSVLAGYFVLFSRGAAMVATGAGLAGAALFSLGKTAGITYSVLKNYAIPAWLASKSFKTLVGELALTFATLGKRIGFATAAFGGLTGAVGIILGGLVRMAAAVAAVVSAILLINEAIDLAFDVNPIMSMGDALEEIVTKYMPGVAAFINSIGSALGLADSKLTKEKFVGPPKSAMTDAKERERIERSVADALAKQRLEIEKISSDYAKVVGNKGDQLKLELSLVGASEAQREQLTALIELDKKREEEIDKIRQLIAGLTEEQKRGGLIEEYKKQISVIEDITRAEEERITTTLAGLAAAKSAEQIRLFGIEQEYKALDELRDIQDEIAKSTMSEIEKKYYDIKAAADKAALAAIRAEEARRGAPLNDKEIEKYYEKAYQGAEKLKKANKDLYEQSRQFSTGWKKAMSEYVDNAFNAARNAENLFNKFFSGVEDMIVEFVKTGEFNWKSFVSMMLEELLRIQLKQVFASLLGGINELLGAQGGIMGGILGDLMNVFGGGGQSKGGSATNPMYVYDVSNGGGAIGGAVGSVLGQGQQQPGIMGTVINGVKSVASGIGSAIGGVVDSVGSVIGGVADTVGSIFSGGGGGSLLSDIGDFFGGWFANGGTLGAGKWGIAGENGPEMISGPASVTPMGVGGTTNVYYTINAVDTRSFQQLLASDPSLIYALTQQGAKSVGGRR